MSRTLRALVLTCLVAAPAFADRPRDVMVRQPADPATAAVTSNVIFLNRCVGGCTVHFGTDNASTDTSSIVPAPGVLTAFAGGDASWTSVVQCMGDVFSPFNVQLVTTRPTTPGYLEIMIAGRPQDIGFGSGVGGIATFKCQPYQQNALVFDFANVWSNGTAVEDICSTAAQEIAHTWQLDHSTIAADPMTYYPYNKRRYYQNMEQQCGSDCVNGTSPRGDTCTGTPAQNHPCSCPPYNQTQNSYGEILTLFGAGTPVPPTVTITAPHNGDNVSPGFAVDATVTSNYGVMSASLAVDGTTVATLTSLPFAFNAPATLGNGSHVVEVTGNDIHGVSSKTSVTVNIGPPCQKPGDCLVMTDTCIGGRCVAGPGTQGGLGMVCTSNAQCSSGQCASDGTSMYCVEPCLTGQCPASFGCQPTGTGSSGMGVCWPGFNDGSGGGCSVGNGGPIAFGLLFASLVFARRRRS